MLPCRTRRASSTSLAPNPMDMSRACCSSWLTWLGSWAGARSGEVGAGGVGSIGSLPARYHDRESMSSASGGGEATGESCGRPLLPPFAKLISIKELLSESSESVISTMTSGFLTVGAGGAGRTGAVGWAVAPAPKKVLIEEGATRKKELILKCDNVQKNAKKQGGSPVTIYAIILKEAIS